MGSGIIFWLLVLVVLCVLLGVVMAASAGRKKKPPPQTIHKNVQTTIQEPPANDAYLTALAHSDPNFSKSEVEGMVSGWALAFELAWGRGDMAAFADNMTKDLCRSYQNQLELMLQNNRAPRSEPVAVEKVKLTDWHLDGTTEYLDTWLCLSKKEVLAVMDSSGNFLGADTEAPTYVLLNWRLSRPAVMLENGVRVVTCPNCGGHTEISANGSCTYCNAPLREAGGGWRLCKVEELRRIKTTNFKGLL